MERFLRDHIRVIPLEPAISDKAVELLKRFRLSHGLLIPDSLIAATDLVTGSPLATKNRSDFHFIDGLELVGLRPG